MDEIEQIEERLQELSDGLPEFEGDEILPDGWTALSEALMASLEGHRATVVGYDYDGEPDACDKCGDLWPCEPVLNVMHRLGMIGAKTARVPIDTPFPRPIENVPPLVNQMRDMVNAALATDNGGAQELAGALGNVIAQHLPNDAGQCPVCLMDWPCFPIRSLAGFWAMSLSPANIGADWWIKQAPSMKTPEQLAEGIRHALCAVDEAGYRLIAPVRGGIKIARMDGPVADSVCRVYWNEDQDGGGAWIVQTWKDVDE